MANAKVTKDLSDNIKAAAILADFYGYKNTYTNTAGSRGGQLLNDKSGSPKVVTFKGTNNIPLKIGDNWYFCDTDVDITIPNDLDDYVADAVQEDGTGTWTASANVTFSTDTGQVKLDIGADFTTGLIGYKDITAKDMTAAGVNSISFLIKSSANLGAGTLRLCIDEHSACASPSYLTIPALAANVQTRVILPLSGITSTDRDAVISIGLDATADPGAINVWLDDIKTTSIKAGADYFVYACDNSGSLVFKVSTASTYPAGFAAATSRKIGGFHTLALDVGTISGHTLTTYATADINPFSIWDLKHRPKSAPAGMAYDPTTGIWVDIYLQSGTSTTTLSVNGGTITDSRWWADHVDDGAAVVKRLLNDAETQTAMEGSNQQTNILASADPVTTGQHIDTAGRRMISNIGLEDGCGVMYQWLSDQSYRFDLGALAITAAAATIALTHDATPGGNPIYVKFGADGNPYLACNIATDSADKWLTFGSAYTLLLKHDASAATGGYQVYFDEDATEPSRLLAATPGAKDVYIPTSNPQRFVKITYNAAPGTPGVAITYDDGADERIEFISPTTANGTADLALLTLTDPAFSTTAAGGNKGVIYKQGTYGDVKLLAGGYWSYSTNCGSRFRKSSSSRWATNTYIGARFASEPL